MHQVKQLVFIYIKKRGSKLENRPSDEEKDPSGRTPQEGLPRPPSTPSPSSFLLSPSPSSFTPPPTPRPRQHPGGRGREEGGRGGTNLPDETPLERREKERLVEVVLPPDLNGRGGREENERRASTGRRRGRKGERERKGVLRRVLRLKLPSVASVGVAFG